MKIVIVGDGKVGLLLTQMLSEDGHDVTVVDVNPQVLDRMQNACDAQAVQGHGASRTTLKQAQADTSDLLIAATSSDEVNLLSCLIAKKIGCKNTIARVRTPEYADDIVILRDEMGLSLTVNPDESCAREVAQLLQFPSFLERERFAGGRVEIVRFTIQADSPLIGVSLRNLPTALKLRVLVCAAQRGDEVVIPGGDFIICPEDDLFITASNEDLLGLIKALRLAQRKVTHATLVGGSRMAVYLAMRHLRSGVDVKVIEKDHLRCEKLSELLPQADIVEADGTDSEILDAEGVARSDALIVLTNIDEENLVLAMYMRGQSLQKIITKCNRSQYATMFRKMGVDTVVSPKTSCAHEIASYVRAMEQSSGRQMVAMHPIAGGTAEAMEFIADKSFPMLGVTLAKLPVKSGILIGSISRGRKVVIPTGATVIEEGDSVVVVAAASRHIMELADILEG